MKQFIREWSVVLIIGILLGCMVVPAFADRQGKARVAAEDDGRSLVWDTMTTISNSNAICKDNGITGEVLISFVNSGAATVDMWLQHSKTETGVFSNAISTAIAFNPLDTDKYIWQGNVKTHFCVRFHTEDSDITTNNTTPDIVGW